MSTSEYKSVYAEVTIRKRKQFTEYRIFSRKSGHGGFPPEMVPVFEKLGVEIEDHWDTDWHRKGWRASRYVTPGEISPEEYLRKKEKQNNSEAMQFMKEDAVF